MCYRYRNIMGTGNIYFTIMYHQKIIFPDLKKYKCGHWY